ncbi:hypothetical protein [Aquabacterium sp.]|uniref:hypothetical protein n=1 Tax=Aquabacterium sp. TaxID=1872578 RepID=UPI002B748E2A|nr:hypothetical protein [Aquabacterium sp.]HSW05361.1 hypothetical protein [Aquabacterium sp.]
MTATTDSLLLKFREKDTRFGVTRSTVKALAGELDITETQVVHMALAKFAEQLLPAYEADDGALTAKQIALLRKDVRNRLPVGEVVERQDLFA